MDGSSSPKPDHPSDEDYIPEGTQPPTQAQGMDDWIMVELDDTQDDIPIGERASYGHVGRAL